MSIDQEKGRKEICAQIRAIRKSRGLTQAQVGKMVGVKEPNVCAVERGTWSPSLDLLLRYGEVLKFKISLIPHEDD